MPTVYACEFLVAFIWCLCKKYEYNLWIAVIIGALLLVGPSQMLEIIVYACLSECDLLIIFYCVK